VAGVGVFLVGGAAAAKVLDSRSLEGAGRTRGTGLLGAEGFRLSRDGVGRTWAGFETGGFGMPDGLGMGSRESLGMALGLEGG
jgi:hypothetical protein